MTTTELSLLCLVADSAVACPAEAMKIVQLVTVNHPSLRNDAVLMVRGRCHQDIMRWAVENRATLKNWRGSS